MKSTKMFIFLFFLASFSHYCFANAIEITLINKTISSTLTSSDSTTNSIYIYPDPSEAYYLKYISYQNGCSKNSVCKVDSTTLKFTVKEIAMANKTSDFCVSQSAPTGRYRVCAENACHISFNGHSLREDNTTNCSGFNLTQNLDVSSPSNQLTATISAYQ